MNRKLRNEELDRLTPEAYKETPKIPLVLILENIRSLHNIGSVFRTADAFRVEGIYLCGYTARPPHREISKTALGATDSVHWRYFLTAEEAIAELRSKGYQIAALEQAEETVLLNDFEPDLDKGLCIVLGNEVKGVTQEVVDTADLCLEIPQFGTKHSLNVSVCAGVILWDMHLKMQPIANDLK